MAFELRYCAQCGRDMGARAARCRHCGGPAAVVLGAIPDSSRFLSGRGRIGRREWWVRYAIPLYGLGFLSQFVDWAIIGDGWDGWLGWALWLALSLPLTAGHTKRLHDRGRSGWFLLVALVPYVGIVWLNLELAVLPGQPGGNRYGIPPMARD